MTSSMKMATRSDQEEPNTQPVSPLSQDLKYNEFTNQQELDVGNVVSNHDNEMIALQKEQEGLDEVKRLSEKEICMKVLGKRSACVFSFKPTTREELVVENEKLKPELQEMKVTMDSIKNIQKMINQLQDFQKRIEDVFRSTPTNASID